MKKDFMLIVFFCNFVKCEKRVILLTLKILNSTIKKSTLIIVSFILCKKKLYGKRNVWEIMEKNGRHSAVKKSKRKVEKDDSLKRTRRKKEYNLSNDLEENEVIVNIPVKDDSFVPDNDKKNKKEKVIDDSKRRRRVNKILKIVLVILITILLVFVTIFARYVIKNGGNVKEAFKEMFRDAVGDQEPIFILVMGISEDISAELTDTIMLIGYNPDTNQAFVLSIPRDSFVGKNINNGGGNDKINALYQINHKNPQKTIEAVENITGVNIDYYVIVKTSVLVKIVDTLGGVDFDVPIDMDYDDDSQDLHIHLKAGQQKLNGDQAEQLVRFRHNNNNTSYPASYGDNDEGRTRTQREFLKVVVTKVLETRNVDKIKTIAKAVFDNLETNIKWDQAVGYLPYAMDFKMDELEMQQLPGEMVKTTLWFFRVDSKKSEEVMNGYIERLGLTDSEKKKFLKPKESIPKTNTVTEVTKKNNTDNNEKKTNTNKNTTEDNTSKKTTNTTSNKTTEKKTTTTKKKEEEDDTEVEVNKPASSSSGSSSNDTSSGGSSSGGSEDSGSGSSGAGTSSGGQSSGGSSETGGGSSSGSESGGGESGGSSSSESGN